MSQTITLTDIIPGTKVQPINAHPMTQVPMTLTKGQGQNFPNGLNVKQLAISWMLFHPQTS